MEYHGPTAIPDEQLIQFFLSSDPAAMETLVYLNKDKIYKTIFSVVQDKHLADEIFHDVFVRIIDSLMAGKQVDEGKFLPWAMSIANLMCIDRLRKAKHAPMITTRQGEQFHIVKRSEAGNGQSIMNHERHDEIRRMIDLLPDEEREVIMLRHYANLSFKEIAEIMKCNINTALGRMRYALANLHRIMEEKQIAA